MARRALSPGLMLALCVQPGFADTPVQDAIPLTLDKVSGSVPRGKDRHAAQTEGHLA